MPAHQNFPEKSKKYVSNQNHAMERFLRKSILIYTKILIFTQENSNSFTESVCIMSVKPGIDWISGATERFCEKQREQSICTLGVYAVHFCGKYRKKT